MGLVLSTSGIVSGLRNRDEIVERPIPMRTRHSLLGFFLVCILIITSMPAYAELGIVDKAVHPGEYVDLDASVNMGLNLTPSVALFEVHDSHDRLMLLLAQPIPTDGNLTLRFRIPSNATIGEYTVLLGYIEENQSILERSLFTVVPKKSSPWGPLLFWGLFTVALVTVGAFSSIESLKYSLLFLLIPLFSRLEHNTVLDNKTRLAIHGLIIENPGIHYKAITREFGLTNGEAVYHLQVLEREDFIRSIRDGRLRRFYSKMARLPEKSRLTPEQIRVKILDLITEQPGISQREIVVHLGLGRDTAGYHLRELVREGYLEAERKGRYTVYRSKRLT